MVGTQGTPVEVLGRLIHHSFFPELWDVRNELTALNRSRRVSWPSLALGCGNFGGIGSAPAFFGQGSNEEEAFAIMDAALGGGDPLVRHRGRLRRRSQREVHRPLARRPAAGRACC